MRARWLVLGSLVALAGCAYGDADRVRLAQATTSLCKHCNCFMPANVDPGATCPVCRCGHVAHECHRGL